MEAGDIIRIIMMTAGILIMLSALWFLAGKRLTADLAAVWEIAGVMLILIGMVSRLSGWTADLSRRQELFAGCAGAAGILACCRFSLLVSRFMMKNHELAIEVSMLLEENKETGQKADKELLVILPVRNEEKNIRKVLEALSSPEIGKIADILCINDASSDSSGEIIDGYRCVQIKNIFGLGYGSALQLGYKYAVRKNYRYVIQMDADGQHDVCNIPVIFNKLKEAGPDGKLPDIVLASRFMEGSSEFPVSAVKKFAFWLFRSMIYMITGRVIADPTTGLQGLGRDAFAYYSGYNNFDYRYPDANMVLQMLLLKFRVAEVPAVMHRRTSGKSMHSGIEPACYMVRMFLSVLAVVVRVKILKNRIG